MIRVIIETSLIDWDGKLTTVLFFDKCNFMCPFCQNWDLLLHPEKYPPIKWHDVEIILHAKKKWIDGVVLTGGEPLVDKTEVFGIANRIKKLGLLVKLDTNGAYPDVLEALIESNRVDYVAMDIKAPMDERYSKAAGKSIDIHQIKRSINILMKGTVDYEFRTTCVPGIVSEDAIADMGGAIRGAKRWILQQYMPENAYLEEYRNMVQSTESEKSKLLTIAAEFVRETKWRGRP
jgi:pyruvate formate lyase activating enzyme